MTKYAAFILLSISTISFGFDIGAAIETGKNVKGLAQSLSDAEVHKIGKQLADQYDKQNPVAKPSDPYSVRLERLTKKHRKEGNHNLNFKVYLVTDVNAFALADGSIRFFAGLMDQMTDNELLFVLGHEIGHVAEGHIANKLRVAHSTRLARRGIAMTDSKAAVIAASDLGGYTELLINSQFSQKEETSADDYGINFMKRHKYPTASAVSAMKKIANVTGEHSFFNTHPDSKKRAERLERQK